MPECEYFIFTCIYLIWTCSWSHWKNHSDLNKTRKKTRKSKLQMIKQQQFSRSPKTKLHTFIYFNILLKISEARVIKVISLEKRMTHIHQMKHRLFLLTWLNFAFCSQLQLFSQINWIITLTILAFEMETIRKILIEFY